MKVRSTNGGNGATEGENGREDGLRRVPGRPMGNGANGRVVRHQTVVSGLSTPTGVERGLVFIQIERWRPSSLSATDGRCRAASGTLLSHPPRSVGERA